MLAQDRFPPPELGVQSGHLLGDQIEKLVHLVFVVATNGQAELLVLDVHGGEATGPRLGRGTDLVVCFVTARRDLERRLAALRRAIEPDGMLWVAWPKRASGVATDMTENVVRDVALPTGLVDTKVCAIDEVWSGLRLVVRRELR